MRFFFRDLSYAEVNTFEVDADAIDTLISSHDSDSALIKTYKKISLKALGDIKCTLIINQNRNGYNVK